jgi:hypothetical protein
MGQAPVGHKWALYEVAEKAGFSFTLWMPVVVPLDLAVASRECQKETNADL